MTGFAFDQDANIIFAALQDAGRAGRLARASAGLRGLRPGAGGGQEQHLAARRLHLRRARRRAAGASAAASGRYYDFAYTNANILFAVIGAQSSFGSIYSHTNSSGIRNADGTFFQVGQPLPANQLGNVTAPLPSHAASPLIKQPYTDQANLGFAKALGKGWAVEVDGVYAKGDDLGLRPRLNAAHRTAARSPRRLAGLVPARIARRELPHRHLARASSHYKGVSVALKKQWDGKLQLLGSYTLSEATSNTSLRATDEFGEYDVLDPIDPFADNQENPTRTDNRHRVTISGVCSPGWDLRISPVFRYKSAQPFNIISGVDTNRDGRHDLPVGPSTANGAEGVTRSTAAVARTSCSSTCACRSGSSSAAARPLEVIAEGFNLTNDTNPGGYVAHTHDGSRHVRPADRLRRRLPARRAAAVPARSALRVLAAS